MIISASRRTDIPAYYSEWFMNRIREKYALVRNPINVHQVSRISLHPDVVDCIVFWSKNPQPMISRMGELHDYMYYFQYTLNAYEGEIERNLPSLAERISTFQALSKKIGKHRIVWRYDPIILNEYYTIDWHINNFSRLADQLWDLTERCTISFIDMYAKITNNVRNLGIHAIPDDRIIILAGALSSVARSHGLIINTCAEKIDLSCCHIEHGSCVDSKMIEKLIGYSVDTEKDRNQRTECGCASSIDLGYYNTCRNGCVYCYANHSHRVLEDNFNAYDRNSPLLCSHITELDKITERKVKSLKSMQLKMYCASDD